MANAAAYIGLSRNGKIDKQADLLDRDPISMRTYMSLVAESHNKKRDIILALVIPEDDPNVPADDNIPTEIASKGIVYLAECINMHRFCVSTSNPNVIAVCKKNVVDPNMLCPIKTIYYYMAKHSQISALMQGPGGKEGINMLRLLEDSPTAVGEMVEGNPVITCHWIGTENDYLSNSVFHTYLEKNKALENVFDAEELYMQEVEKEKKVLRIIIFAVAFLLCVSFSVRAFALEMSYFTACLYAAAASGCGLMWYMNERI
ncbi:uncharacterized protein NEMAJ01_1559 [Nematocida major]|uniref:uncharacterized protein n=1 Tax=Nematocida major TaxID=1912982 RepID=UPI002007A3B3|nr:uncharacterized protein NEMAJ01_1559 [Nematocida major]KAH9386663.1 hypothetical protein NEMAJ01_1559 [Nematocida major]